MSRLVYKLGICVCTWAYTYAQFDQLLAAYPEVHPKGFVTFGILQEQPRRGSCREWGKVARVLSHMIGRRQSLINELVVIVNWIQHLDREDPMRATEERGLVDVLLKEHCRLVFPERTSQAQLEPLETLVAAHHLLRQRQDPHLGHVVAREDQSALHHPSLGP